MTQSRKRKRREKGGNLAAIQNLRKGRKKRRKSESDSDVDKKKKHRRKSGKSESELLVNIFEQKTDTL